MVNSLLNCLEARLQRMVWQDQAHISAVRKRMFRIIALCFNQPKYIVFAPDDCREAEDFKEAFLKPYQDQLSTSITP